MRTVWVVMGSITLVILLIWVAVLAAAFQPPFVSEGDQQRRSALVSAVEAGDDAKVKALLEQGTGPNLFEVGNLDTVGHRASYQDRERSMLMVASQLGRVEAMRMLLDRGARVDYDDSVGNTALMVAAPSERKEAVALLLERGADPLKRNQEGKTALSLAKEARAKAVVPLLQEAEARAFAAH